jgi:hypothetical protein
MNINPTMSMNFGAKIPTTITKMTLPGRNVSKVNIEVASEIGKKVTALKYKAGDIEQSFVDKAGFSDQKFAEIVENVQGVIKEGIDFLAEFFKAQKKIL